MPKREVRVTEAIPQPRPQLAQSRLPTAFYARPADRSSSEQTSVQHIEFHLAEISLRHDLGKTDPKMVLTVA